MGETPMRAAMVVLVMAGLAEAAGPWPSLTAEHRRLDRLRDGFFDAGYRSWQAGKRAEAIAALEKTLVIEMDLVGPWHRSTESTAHWLASCYEACEEWTQSARSWRMVLEARRRLDGEGHWKTAEARMNLAEMLAQKERTPAQRKALERGRQ